MGIIGAKELPEAVAVANRSAKRTLVIFVNELKYLDYYNHSAKSDAAIRGPGQSGVAQEWATMSIQRTTPRIAEVAIRRLTLFTKPFL